MELTLLESRQGDVPEPLPGARAVHLGGLVEGGVDGLESAEQRDHHERHTAPGVDHDRGEPLPERVLQPCRRGQVQRVQCGVDDAAVGEHETPAEDGDEGRHGPGQHQDQPVQRPPPQLLVEQQREAEADAVVEGDAQGRPDDRPDEVRPETVIGGVAPQDVGVVVEADELVGGVDVVDADRAGRVEAVGVGEREVDAVDQG